MSKRFVPIETADIKWNKNLPLSNLYQDIYFSMESGILQSQHVFVEGNNLFNRWLSLAEGEHFTIGETGFGTGLNFLLTWSLWEKHAPKNAFLHFISCEKYPLKAVDLEKALSNWPELQCYREELLKQYPVLTPGNHYLSFADGRIKLTLMLGDCFECFEQLLECGDSLTEQKIRSSFINAWYLDGFAPKKNESMWTKNLIQVVSMLSMPGTTLATYTVAASIKILLSEVGFTITKKKGFGIKRHMLTACLEQNARIRIKQRTTPWHTAVIKPNHEKTALIVGAGLAGCFAAHTLAKRGWKITILDKNHDIAQGASANQAAVLFPKLSAFRSPLTELMLMSFLYAEAKYKKIIDEHGLGELSGALNLPFTLKELKAQTNLEEWLSIYPELGKRVCPTEASILAGIPINIDCLHIPNSGWINSPDLCNFLVSHEHITVVNNFAAEQFTYSDQWLVDQYRASVLILANGFEINQFNETQHLPIKAIRGQMTAIPATKESKQLKIPVCAEGHVLPVIRDIHYLGASYELECSTSEIKEDDDLLNLKKLNAISNETNWSKVINTHWAGVRASTPDYLPVVGPIPEANKFIAQFAGLATNSKRWIPTEAAYYPNLYAFAGFGSRGLTTIPLCAEWLAALINRELSGAPRDLVQSLSPARFLIRNITRGLYSLG